MKTIITERLTLRELLIDDLDAFYEYTKSINITSMLNWLPHIDKQDFFEFLKSYIENNDVWAIVLKENGKVIGHLKIYPDDNYGKKNGHSGKKLITYALSEDYWGNGYMTEAVKRAVKYAFEEMNVELLIAFHIPHNKRSKRVIEKCGFRYEITIEQGFKYYDGQVFDNVCYTISKSDYYRE